MKLLLESADGADNALAQFMVADAYLQGDAVAEDEKKAISYLKRAAGKGLEQAQLLLSELDGDVSYSGKAIGAGKVRL